MIYFLQPVAGGPVKIGTTVDVEARHRQLESHYGVPLALLATMPGGREEEAEIHARFGHLRFGRTEQFRPAPELMEFIGRPLLVGANPEAVEAMERSATLKPAVLQMKGTDEWKGWLDRLARYLRMPTSAVVDNALVEYAKAKGFTEEAPER